MLSPHPFFCTAVLTFGKDVSCKNWFQTATSICQMMVLKHCLAEFGCLFLAMPGDLWDLSWRRKWQPIPVFLPRESCGQRSLVGCCPYGCTGLDTTEVTEHACMHWRRKWQPTPVFLPGESQGQRSVVGCRLWGGTASDTTEATSQQQQLSTSQLGCVDLI